MATSSGSTSPEDPHREARPGEGLALHEGLVQAQEAAHGAHLVLEEVPQGLHHLHVHALREAAHVVVALDDLGRARDGRRLDAVGVDGALGEEGDVAHGPGFLLEDLDEGAAHGLALVLRVAQPLQRREEARRRVHGPQLEVELLGEGLLHQARLVLAEEAVVDEEEVEALAHRLVDEEPHDGGVHAAGDGAQDPLSSNPASYLLHR